MSFVKQYDRLFVTTFGVVNLIRGGGGILEFVVELTGKFYRVRHPIRKVGQPPDSETLEDRGNFGL